MNICKQCGWEHELPWVWPAADLCPTCAHLLKKASAGGSGSPGGKPLTVGKTPLAFRDLKATLPAIEFGAIQWAAKRAGAGHSSQALEVFLRLAVLERVREVVRGEIARGKSIPADIAAVLADCHR